MQTVTQYSAQTQEKIQELIEDNYYDQDMFEFIEEYGEDNFRKYYEEYVRFGEENCYEAVDAFVQNEGIENVEKFEDAYYGAFDWEDFVIHFADETVVYQIPRDLQMYFDYDKYGRDLAYDYIEYDGYIFDRNY